MFTHYRTEAVVLNKADRQEADQLLVVYTKEFGRIEIVAKGIRKIASKLRSAIEFALVAEVEFIQGKSCKTLTDAVILIPSKQLRDNNNKFEAARRFVDLSEALIKDQQDDPSVWNLICAGLTDIGKASPESLNAVYQHYAWHLFTILGWRPEFGRQSTDIMYRSLVDFFRDSEIEKSSRMRLTKKQNDALIEIAWNYRQLITK